MPPPENVAAINVLSIVGYSYRLLGSFRGDVRGVAQPDTAGAAASATMRAKRSFKRYFHLICNMQCLTRHELRLAIAGGFISREGA